MEAAWATILTLILIIVLIWAWKILNWLWFKPKRLEKLLREQGFQANPYKLLVGDSKELLKMRKEALSKPMNLSDDILPRVSSDIHHSVKTHGMFVMIFIYLLSSSTSFILIIHAHGPVFLFECSTYSDCFIVPYTVCCVCLVYVFCTHLRTVGYIVVL